LFLPSTQRNVAFSSMTVLRKVDPGFSSKQKQRRPAPMRAESISVQERDFIHV
jgi:hypothetical protein